MLRLKFRFFWVWSMTNHDQMTIHRFFMDHTQKNRNFIKIQPKNEFCGVSSRFFDSKDFFLWFCSWRIEKLLEEIIRETTEIEVYFSILKFASLLSLYVYSWLLTGRSLIFFQNFGIKCALLEFFCIFCTPKILKKITSWLMSCNKYALKFKNQ
jgi:hypothetical protein